MKSLDSFLENKFPHQNLYNSKDDDTYSINSEFQICNIAKAVKRINSTSSKSVSLSHIEEKNDKVTHLPFDKINTKDPLSVGTLSNLGNLNIEEFNPINKINIKETPGSSGVKDSDTILTKLLDTPISRNFPPKIKKKGSNSTKTPNSTFKIINNNQQENNFSSFLQKNMLLNYYDKSPIFNDITPGTDTTKLTKPIEFIMNGNLYDNDKGFFNHENSNITDNDNKNDSWDENPKDKNGDITIPEAKEENSESEENRNIFVNMNDLNQGNFYHNRQDNINIKHPFQQNQMDINMINQMNNLNLEINNNKNNEGFTREIIPQYRQIINNNFFSKNKQFQNSNFPFYYNYNQPHQPINNINQNNFYLSNYPNITNQYIPNFNFQNNQNQIFQNNNHFNSNKIQFYNESNNNINANFNPLLCKQNFTSMQNNAIRNNNSKYQKIPLKKTEKFPLQSDFYNMSIGEIIQNSNLLSKNQSGCRFLQKKIEEQPEIATQILNNALKNLKEIIMDQFGNYLIQKIFDYMSNDQFCQFLALIQKDIYKICINSYGTRVIQKMIDYLLTDILIITFLNEIKSIVKSLIIDINGSHIILKLIDLNNPIVNKVIFLEICENIVQISMHKHGCCVLQKCIEKAQNKQRYQIYSLLLFHCKELILDQCGNYIIQFILTLGIEEITLNICNQVIENIEAFSKQKFSSNVVEKCLENGAEEVCSKIINAMFDSNIVVNLLFDKFGNYVLQKALHRANPLEQKKILTLIAPHLQSMKNLTFGSKLYSKLIIEYPYLTQIILKREVTDETKANGQEPQNEF